MKNFGEFSRQCRQLESSVDDEPPAFLLHDERCRIALSESADQIFRCKQIYPCPSYRRVCFLTHRQIHADCLPQNGVTVMLKLLKKLRHWFRSSITGKFVSAAYAKANPRTTVEEKDRG